MLILGIDPGLRITGYGALRLSGKANLLIEAGVVRTTDSADLSTRLAELVQGLEEVVESADPDVVVVESLYSHYKHPRTAILMGHARAMALIAAARKQIPVIDYPATKIKKSLTGNGRASKAQMQRAIATTLALAKPPEPPDVADALAVALCHANAIRHANLGASGVDKRKWKPAYGG